MLTHRRWGFLLDGGKRRCGDRKRNGGKGFIKGIQKGNNQGTAKGLQRLDCTN
jgi:hypothetical protein